MTIVFMSVEFGCKCNRYFYCFGDVRFSL